MNSAIITLCASLAVSFGFFGEARAQSTAMGAAAASGATAELEMWSTQMDDLALSRGEAKVIGKTADTFTDFAGSHRNAANLAAGLRTGTEITLTGRHGWPGPGGSVTFTPPTEPMGHGNVFKSLALAQQLLASYGITDPTPRQIEAALNGGTIFVRDGHVIRPVELQGVLQMRAEGMGWGEIAHAQGTKLGPVVSALRSASGSIAATPKGTGSPAAGNARGAAITNAAGASAGTATKHAGNTKGAGIVDASGSKSSSGASQAGRGIQNAMGGNAGSAHGNAYGKSKGEGIVTATGTSASTSSAGAGIVSAAGGGHGVAAAGGAASNGRGAGAVSTAAGQGGGHAYGLAKKQP